MTMRSLTKTFVDGTLGFRLCVLALLLSLVLFVLGLGLIYWGDEYAVPAWSESSVPPPQPPY